ncbi:plasmid replication protein RepA2 (plasmid) [Ensifer adhaerens OV14]|nr:plasmid replication protein RepA2 [Ensifer adhaerens OV14]
MSTDIESCLYFQTETMRQTRRNRFEETPMLKPANPQVENETTSERITRQATALSDRLRAVGEIAFPPKAMKSLRSFTSGEVAQIVGVSDGYLRQLSLDGLGPMPELGTAGRRSYTLRQINELRAYLAEARPKEALKFWPRRREGDKLQIISVANFKGGSAKTTSSLYLAQGLALQGYRVLAIDLDPQASLSAMFGYQPEFDIAENTTLYGAIRYDEERVNMRSVIRSTYFEGIDLVPGNLELMEFEHETPRAMGKRSGPEDLFFRRVAAAIDEVEADYDVVVIDCPPQLGFLTMGALNAATGMLVTIHPQMVDVASMSQFLLMTADLIAVIEDAGAHLNYDFMKFVVTRHDPRDVPEQEIVGLLRDLFGSDVLRATAWKSTAIANAGLTKQSLFELSKGAVGRSVYDRAMESVNAVNTEVIDLISKVWQR